MQRLLEGKMVDVTPAGKSYGSTVDNVKKNSRKIYPPREKYKIKKLNNCLI